MFTIKMERNAILIIISFKIKKKLFLIGKSLITATATFLKKEMNFKNLKQNFVVHVCVFCILFFSIYIHKDKKYLSV